MVKGKAMFLVGVTLLGGCNLDAVIGYMPKKPICSPAAKVSVSGGSATVEVCR